MPQHHEHFPNISFVQLMSREGENCKVSPYYLHLVLLVGAELVMNKYFWGCPDPGLTLVHLTLHVTSARGPSVVTR